MTDSDSSLSHPAQYWNAAPPGWSPPYGWGGPPPGWVLVPAQGASAPAGSPQPPWPPAPTPGAAVPVPGPVPLPPGSAVLPPGAPPLPSAPAPVGLAAWENRAYASLLDIAVWVSLVQAYYLLLTTVGWAAQVLVWLAGGDYGTVVSVGYWGITLAWWGWQWSLRGRNGQSLGQRLIGVRVVDIQTRQPIGPVRSVLRSLTHVLDVAPACLGLARPAWDRQRQTWADKIHQTVVVATR
ncbi:RDD family protein [Streptomyces liangshanensis]|uniref:RDD family protein n=1 Tax=Streptomyces liangshanensis TaxID=2717324 RepID=UPI0036D8DE2D